METWLAQLPPLFKGLAVTLELTLGAAILALLLSLAAGYARSSRSAWAHVPATCYVELFRGTSSLVQLFWFYYVLPLFGIELPAMMVGITVLGLNAGAYGAEIVRGAIAAVPREQYEAALALNMSTGKMMQRIVIPQAIPAMLPPAGNLLIELLKNTSLVSLITIADLTFSAEILRAESLHTIEIFSTILVMYFIAASGIAASVRRVERWFSNLRGT